ncbi:uncharacterized protein [Littorina saxatilis]|uniref:uncharacterized protein n=1 Tax=Littorina saxatilis TaxID=31220 RepID=UPI0038B4CBCF
MIRSIKTLREDIAAKKCYDVPRTRTSFPELLKGIHEEERRGSESDTFTDGACVLLRRKMHKARRASCPAIDVNMANQGGDGSQAGNGAQQPQRRLSRQKSRDAVGMRALLEEEDRQHTQIKVATEWRRYDDIRTRIGHFLQDAKTTSQRRASFPVIISSPDEATVVNEET